MLDVIELESRYKTYKIKSYIPHAIIAISTIIISITLFVINSTSSITIEPEINIQSMQSEKKEPVKPKEEITPKKQIVKEVTNKELKPVEKAPIKKVEVTQPQIPIKKEIKEKTILTPSLDFMKKMRDDTLPYYESPKEDSKVSISNTKAPKETLEIKKEPVEKKSSKKSSIMIKRQNTQEDISHVIKRFKKNNNPALSLFVAKKYYELGDYHKSYNYALITNEINNNIEASWIIFAKSLVKLNKKEMAIKTLKKYIEHSHSNRANILLDEIISGKFK